MKLAIYFDMTSNDTTENLFNEPMKAVENLYKTYLELANYKVKELLIQQFKRDLFFKTGLGVALLGILMLSMAGVYFLAPYVKPGFVLIFLAIIAGIAAYQLIRKAIHPDSTTSTEVDLTANAEKQIIEENISLATKRFALALDHTEEKALDRINPILYVSEKVRQNPGKSLGIAVALGLSTIFSRDSAEK